MVLGCPHAMTESTGGLRDEDALSEQFFNSWWSLVIAIVWGSVLLRTYLQQNGKQSARLPKRE